MAGQRTGLRRYPLDGGGSCNLRALSYAARADRPRAASLPPFHGQYAICLHAGEAGATELPSPRPDAEPSLRIRASQLFLGFVCRQGTWDGVVYGNGIRGEVTDRNTTDGKVTLHIRIRATAGMYTNHEGVGEFRLTFARDRDLIDGSFSGKWNGIEVDGPLMGYRQRTAPSVHSSPGIGTSSKGNRPHRPCVGGERGCRWRGGLTQPPARPARWCFGALRRTGSEESSAPPTQGRWGPAEQASSCTRRSRMERRTLGVCVGGLLLVAVVSVAAMRPTGQLVEADDTVVGYRAWVPDDVASLRGVIVGSMGANWDSGGSFSGPLEAAGRNWGFALLGTNNRKKAAMKQGDDAVGDDLLKALAIVGRTWGTPS